jgi:hypothetical protein
MKQIQIARAMLALTVADRLPHPTPNEFDSGPAVVIRKVNYKLKAKNRAARHEKNRQNKRMRHAA